MSTTADRRQKRKEIRFLQSESAWLQKARFALQKAEAAREKLADARDEEPEPYTLPLDDGHLALEAFEEALEARAQTLLEAVQEQRQSLR